jgi:purine-binding chemotaxis protein CheW
MSSTETQFCTFRAADRLFGVPVQDVKEITTETTCTLIPHAPEVVLGYVNIRGQIILALDLKILMGWSGSEPSQLRCMVIFKPVIGPLFGLVVDEVCEIVSLNSDHLESFRSGGSTELGESRAKLIHGVAKLEHQLVVLLNSRMLLPYVENVA